MQNNKIKRNLKTWIKKDKSIVLVLIHFYCKKGLSEYLFDEKREHEKILDSVQPTTRSTTRTSTYLLNDEDEDDDDDVIKNDLIDPNKPNNYHLITKSTYADCYMIDKENYFKYMLTFSSDKSQINQYLDEMVKQFFKF